MHRKNYIYIISYIMLGFGGMTENEISEGIMLLNDVWFKKDALANEI
ncbi:hypothetical protein [Clostridium lacusfryxellense]|nr:hypothetical protein [Clostridium lacusfryxellense]MBU3113496.1 hypothetical protein [Clostridium lacusfryxellense]